MKRLISEIKFDEADSAIVNQYKWYVSDTGYAVWRGIEDGKKKTIRLHRLIAGTPDGMVTDHKNHDRLDNRRSNLRVCDQKGNMQNFSAKGYCFDKSKNKWMVRYKDTFYGRYDTEQEAAQAYKLARSGVPYIKSRRKYWNLPTGVTKQFGKYSVRPQLNGVRYSLGAFETVDQAELALNNWKARMA